MQQGSLEWLTARVGVPTASELHQLLTPKWKLRDGEMPHTYLAKKLAERWTGEPLQMWSGGAMEQGSILEDEALPWFAFEYDVTVERVGFLTTDAGDFGCSPDGWIPKDRTGVEIKCPELHTHTKWLLDGGCPSDHIAQVQGSMFVTGAESWTFVSYSRQMPKLVVNVIRDPAAMEAIEEAVAWFKSEFVEGWDRLVALNGGEPKSAAQREEEEVLSF